MKPVRIVVLTVAVVSAVGLAVVVRMALTGKPTTQASAHAMIKPKPTAQVLVARHDLKVGDRLADADLSWQSFLLDEVKPEWTTQTAAPAAAPATAASSAPASGAAPAAPAAPAAAPTGTTKQVGANGGVLQVASATMQTLQTGGPKQPFLGAVVRQPISAGEPITARKIVRAGESGYLAVVLAPGKRAMSVPVTVDSAAGGFVLPGDRVDVILSRKLDGSVFESRTVLRNMKVLAIDQTTQTEKDAAAVIGATATLEVSGDEAETLAVSKQAGTLSLTLRSYADARAASGRAGAAPLSRISDASGNGGGGGGGGAPSANHGVKVYRGGELSEAPVS